MSQEELIRKQLEKVVYADLSQYDSKTNTYYIPRKRSTRLEQNRTYLVKIKEGFFHNEIAKANYNRNTLPPFRECVVDVLSVLGKMVKVNAVKHTPQGIVSSQIWGGYIPVSDIEVIKEL